MFILEGKGTVDGIAIGNISIYDNKEGVIEKYTIEDTGKEIKRFHNAREISKKQIQSISESAVSEVLEASLSIFEAHIQLIDDVDFIDKVEKYITSEMINAEYAVKKARDFYMDMFAAFEDEYMKARVSDIVDISTRVINNLQIDKMSDEKDMFSISEPRIIFAEDLTPSETVQLDKKNVLAFVTKKGTMNSHSSILARMMNIPAVVGIPADDYIEDDIDGCYAIVDGYSGIIIINPTEEVIADYKERMKEEQAERKLLLKLKGKKNITKDGRIIDIYANIGSPLDIKDAIKYDAGGIGLFRTEFLFLQGDSFPTEEEQFEVYKEAALAMKGKKVVIRTLDIGADKKIPYFPMESEVNPAMGYRGIRISLTEQDVFKTQLRAVYRAAAYGNVAVLFPMIVSIKEVERIKEIIEIVKEELVSSGLKIGSVEIGVMIETPAAVMISEELGKVVDFFSIGTNDLTQYTLAIDRQNHLVDEFYDAHHEAVLRMIKLTIDNGHKTGCKVSICGELATDIELTEKFIDMGVDALSVSSAYVLKLRNVIRNI